jgi:hypothetical protein
MVRHLSIDNKHPKYILQENAFSVSPFFVFDDNTKVDKQWSKY